MFWVGLTGHVPESRTRNGIRQARLAPVATWRGPVSQGSVPAIFASRSPSFSIKHSPEWMFFIEMKRLNSEGFDATVTVQMNMTFEKFWKSKMVDGGYDVFLMRTPFNQTIDEYEHRMIEFRKRK